MHVPTDWTSGIYVAVLTNARRYQNYVVFVVRDDRRHADFLYQQSVATYQAYNNFPDDHVSGKSLYSFNSSGPRTIAGETRAVKVSFDRPYTSGAGAGLLFQWDLPLLRWLEREGYDVTYSTDVDTHEHPSRLLDHKAFFSTGHDEYWSREMYDAAVAARDAGVSLAFFGADAVSWQVRFEPSERGDPDRVLVCYRDARLDPAVDLARKTVHWADPPLRRPPQALVGVQFGAQVHENGALVAPDPLAWPFAGSGFTPGSRAAGLVGYEVDRYYPELGPPDATSFALLTTSPVLTADGRPTHANSSLYQARSGAWVFASGTMSWAWGLDAPGYTDRRVQRVTSSLLDLFLGRVPVGNVGLPPPTTPAAPQSAPGGWAPAPAPGPTPDALQNPPLDGSDMTPGASIVPPDGACGVPQAPELDETGIVPVPVAGCGPAGPTGTVDNPDGAPDTDTAAA